MVFRITLPPSGCLIGLKTESHIWFFLCCIFEKSASQKIFRYRLFLPVSPHLPMFLFQPCSSREEASIFKKCLFASCFLSSFINSIPDTFPGFINITSLFRSNSAAWTIPHSFGTFHRTDKSSLLQQAISAHTAAKQRSLYKDLELWQEDVCLNFSFLNG